MDIDLTFRPDENLPISAHDEIREMGRIIWSDALMGWLVWSYDDVKSVLANSLKFTLEGTPISESFGTEAMLVDDTPLHHTMRAVWDKRLSLNAIEARAAEVREIAIRLLEPVGIRLNVGETVDIVDAFRDFTAEIITWTMGIPRNRVGDLQRWNRMFSDTPVLELIKDSPEYARHFETRSEVYAFLHEEMSNRRKRLSAGEQPDDLVSLMVAAEGRDGITRNNSADNLLNFFLGGIDTTSKWLGNIVVMLSRHRRAFEEVRADRRLLPQAVDEVMRVETVPQLLLRLVRNDDTMLAGQSLKAGDRMYVLPGAANRDPYMFENANDFDIHRPHNKPHLGFGFGMHHCLGKNIARTEAITFIGVLLDMFSELEIVDVDYGPTWALWGPLGLRIRLAISGK